MEVSVGHQRRDSTDKGLESYIAASDIAVTELSPTHPTHLALALNFSVFHYGICNNPVVYVCSIFINGKILSSALGHSILPSKHSTMCWKSVKLSCKNSISEDD